MTSRLPSMHQPKLVLWGCLALALFGAACGSQAPPDTRAADETTIRSLDADWSKAAGAQDVEGTVAFYADDASLLPPNAPILSGKAAIRSDWATLLVPGTSLSWHPEKVEVARSGDLAYSMGVYQITMKDPQGKSISDHGKYLEVWKKQADGKWKAVADTYNSDVPAPTPEKASHEKRRHPRAAAHHKKRRR